MPAPGPRLYGSGAGLVRVPCGFCTGWGRAGGRGACGSRSQIPLMGAAFGTHPGSCLAATESSAILLAVEQRIGPTIPPTPPAGVDPAYIPGLVPPRAAQPGETVEPEQAAEAAQEEATASPVLVKEQVADAEPLAEDAEDADEAEEADAEEPEDDGLPTFEASDRRGAIIADRAGITFRLDTEVAEFGWDEVQAVEIDTPRFGKRFGVTVYTSERRWFQSDVEAGSRSELKEWAAGLDAVLDARFEDGEEGADAPEVEAEAEAGPEAEVVGGVEDAEERPAAE